MSKKVLRVSIIVFAVALLAGILFFSFDLDMRSQSIVPLSPPTFVNSAKAAEMSGLSSIVEEAGISAYYQAPTVIDIQQVRSVFRTIETETSEYIIGSVPVTNYPDSQDVHVYVHKDGWILAYYLSADPVGKILDWRLYRSAGHTNITTKLENTLAVVAGEASVSYTGGTHYDFRYPNATNVMIIVEHSSGGTDSFEINVPGSFAFSERSWSGMSTDDGGIKLDGVTLKSFSNCGQCTAEGTLTASELLPDQFHTFTVSASDGNDHVYGGLVLVYRE